MGYWKNKALEWEERGYGSVDTVVCRGCVGDYALKDFIKENGDKQKCSYCSKIKICANLEDVIGQIVSGANAEYEDANGCMSWDHEEGGFYGASSYDYYDFVNDILNDEMQIENEKLISDISKTLGDATIWCERDPYSLRMHEEDYNDWEEFCNSIQANKAPISEMASSYDILGTVGAYIEKIGIVVTLNKKFAYFRCRPHKKTESYNNASDIGSAPSYAAEENRMSQKGVSMFYGAEDIDTTLVEVDAFKAESATIAKFYPTKRIVVIDFTKLKQVKFPSLFDTENRDKRSPLIFLRSFASDISKPINNNKIEYLPTQVFTEYLKSVYKPSDGRTIDGIIYESSKNIGGKCCALFFSNDQCTDKKNEKSKKLWMDKASIIRILG